MVQTIVAFSKTCMFPDRYYFKIVLLANYHELAESKMVQKEVLRDVSTVHVRLHVLPRVSIVSIPTTLFALMLALSLWLLPKFYNFAGYCYGHHFSTSESSQEIRL